MLEKSWTAEILGREYRVIPTEVPDCYKVKRYIWDKDYGCTREESFHIWAQRVNHTRADIVREAEEYLLYG